MFNDEPPLPSERDMTGEAFTNTYGNGTLVGNWLEDRLQCGAPSFSGDDNNNHNATSRHDDGLLEDPRITRCHGAPQVRQDLMRTTYGVDYSRKGGDTGLDAQGNSNSGTTSVQSVLSATAMHAMGGRDGSSGKSGVDRALLFSNDPVADPVAALPTSTNTDTYGAYFRDSSKGDGSSSSSSGCLAEGGREQGTATGTTSGCGGGKTHSRKKSHEEEHNLYDSVVAAGSRQAVCSTETCARTKGLSSMSSSSSKTVHGQTVGFASLAALSAGHGHKSSSGGGTRRSALHRGDVDEDGDEADARWRTSKQVADVPVEHYVFQRRLPPVWM